MTEFSSSRVTDLCVPGAVRLPPCPAGGNPRAAGCRSPRPAPGLGPQPAPRGTVPGRAADPSRVGDLGLPSSAGSPGERSRMPIQVCHCPASHLPMTRTTHPDSGSSRNQTEGLGEEPAPPTCPASCPPLSQGHWGPSYPALGRAPGHLHSFSAGTASHRSAPVLLSSGLEGRLLREAFLDYALFTAALPAPARSWGSVTSGATSAP